MVSFHEDQAEGLRRMLGGKRPRIFTFVSTLEGDDKALMLGNLCSSLAAGGSEVLLLNACKSGSSFKSKEQPRKTIRDVANGAATLDEVLEWTHQGFATADLQKHDGTDASRNAAHGMESLFIDAASRFGTVIVDCEIEADHVFSLAPLARSEIVVQVTPSPASIKNAYSMVKHLNARLGRRPFGLVVTGATEMQAATVYANMAEAAGRYLAVSLQWFGSIPADEHVRRAAGLGRPVTDAFPLAGASIAFRRLAQRFALPDTWREASQPY